MELSSYLNTRNMKILINETQLKYLITESKEVIGGTFETDLENSPKHHSKRAFGNWQSDNAWDIFSPPGTVVNSYTDGVVKRVKRTNKTTGKVFGTQITIKGDNDYPDIFYTHLKNVNLEVGDKVKVGDYIGEISEWDSAPKITHVHIGLPVGQHLRDLLNRKDSTKIFSGDKTVSNSSYEKPENKEFEIKKDERIENGKVKITGNFDSEQLTNINFLIDEMNKEGITDPYAQIGILSVIKKESGFKPKSEVSYHKTSNERIRKLFGKRVANYSDSELDELKKDVKKFFNVIYAKTVGNQGGNDGYNYRGRGFNQLTGIKNYEKYSNMIGMGNQLVQDPDLVNDPKIAAKIALKFFTKGKPASEFPKFNSKEEAAIKFADINAGGGASSHRDSALKASENFEVVA